VVAAWQTVHSGTVSPPLRSRAAPLPAPRECDLWCLVCLWWRSCDKGGRCVVLQELRRTCLHRINDAGRTAPRPFCSVAPHSTQRTPRIACDRHQYQQQCVKEGAGQQRWHTASAQNSTEALNDSAAQCSQGSSWVSGLLVGVRWRMGAWSRGSPSEAVCVRAYMQAHTHFLVKSRMCNIEAIVQNNCHLHIPTILEWIYDHQPLLKSPDCLSPLAL